MRGTAADRHAAEQAEQLRQHREWVRHLRRYPETIPVEYRIKARTAEQRAADLEQCRQAWSEWADETIRMIDLYRKGAHQPKLLEP